MRVGGNEEQMSGATDTSLVTAEETRKGFWLGTFLKRLVREKPLGTVGAIIVLLLLVAGVFADLSWLGLPDIGLAPYHYKEIHVIDRLSPPGTAGYLLGTDGLGRDLLSRIIYGARISMIVGLGANVLRTVVSTVIGLSSGYIGGKFDLFVQRFVDAWMCFPGLVILLLLMSIIGPGIVQLILVLGISGGISASRGKRALAFWVKESVYIEASRALGANTWSTLATPPAQCHANDSRQLLNGDRGDNPGRGLAELPWIRHTATVSKLGRYDQRHGTFDDEACPLAAAVARYRPEPGRLRGQRVRRRSERPA